MDQAVVRALGRKLLGRQLISVAQAGSVGLTQRNMRRCILIEQGIQEQQSAGCNRRRVRHECHLAQTPRTFIGVDQSLQHLLTPAGACVHNAAFFKSHLNAFDHRALMR